MKFVSVLLLAAASVADKSFLAPPPPPAASPGSGTSSYSSYGGEGQSGMYGQTTTRAPQISAFYGVPASTPSPTTTPRMSYGPPKPSSTTGAPASSLPYPSYDSIPPGLDFSCSDRLDGYYADPEAQCQVWHWCVPGGFQYSFLCPVQTVFNQASRTCDWWYNVDCEAAPDLYVNNEELYKVRK